jgi:NAD(P) transhydrogenase subunit alpha
MAELLFAFNIFILATFVGLEVISKVPRLLHTPLMSGSNAISGISIIGALLVAGAVEHPVRQLLGFIAVVLAMINVVGGFVVTDRMLEMFKRKPDGAGTPPRS